MTNLAWKKYEFKTQLYSLKLVILQISWVRHLPNSKLKSSIYLENNLTINVELLSFRWKLTPTMSILSEKSNEERTLGFRRLKSRLLTFHCWTCKEIKSSGSELSNCYLEKNIFPNVLSTLFFILFQICEKLITET